MTKLQIPIQLFDLTKEQKDLSKEIYGKTIRCLIAPYHSYAQLESIVPYTQSTYLFPEREMSYDKVRGFMSMMVASKHSDVFIITSHMTIIADMVGDLVRVLTEDNKIVDPAVKTFHANIHEIRYKLLENETFALSREVKSHVNQKINDLINRINSKKPATQKEYDKLREAVEMIGEPVIRMKLHQMLSDSVKIKK